MAAILTRCPDCSAPVPDPEPLDGGGTVSRPVHHRPGCSWPRPLAARLVRCRMLDDRQNRCTAEAVDPEGEILICVEHAARVLELLVARGAAVDALLFVAAATR